MEDSWILLSTSAFHLLQCLTSCSLGKTVKMAGTSQSYRQNSFDLRGYQGLQLHFELTGAAMANMQN